MVNTERLYNTVIITVSYQNLILTSYAQYNGSCRHYTGTSVPFQLGTAQLHEVAVTLSKLALLLPAALGKKL